MSCSDFGYDSRPHPALPTRKARPAFGRIVLASDNFEHVKWARKILLNSLAKLFYCELNLAKIIRGGGKRWVMAIVACSVSIYYKM